MTGPDPNSDERRRREADFHDRWAAEVDVASVLVDETFTSVTAVENRYILQRFGDLRGLSLLDYGCGAAEGGIYLAKRGARVVAVDVSPGSLELAQRLAAYHGVQIETRLVTGAGIPAETGEFDRVYGNGVLHHVPLPETMYELGRVMNRPGSIGCFIEPLPYNPAIEVYRKLASQVRTEDEQPLSFDQVERFGEVFGTVEHREFWLTTLSVFFKFFLVDRVSPNQERYWKKIYTDADRIEWFFRPLRRLDERLLDRFPALGRWSWTTVISLSDPRARGEATDLHHA